MLFRADALGFIGESSEANNDVILTVNVANPNRPDLLVISTSISPAGPYTVGQSLTFRGTVRNGGTASTVSPFNVRFCYDNVNCLTSITNRVGADITQAALASGTNSPLLSSTATYTATFGAHTLYMCADVGLAIVELDENNNCGSFGFTVNPLQPNLTVGVPSTSPATVSIGTPMNVSANITNSGAANAANNFYNRLRVNNGGGFVTVNPDQLIPNLNMGNTTLVNWPYTPTVSGNHTFEVCADTSDTGANNNRIAESNEGDNCNSVIVSVSAALPWLKTSGGNVGSRSNISANWPTTGCNIAPVNPLYCNSSYMINAAGSVTSNTFKSAKNWLLSGYTPGLGSKYYNYATFYSGFSESVCTRTAIPNNRGRFIINSSVTFTGGTDTSTCSAFTSSKDAAVVFINGSLNINSNLNLARPTVFIVRDNISVAAGVGTANGMFVANGSFTTNTSNQVLRVNGSIAAALEPAGTTLPGGRCGLAPFVSGSSPCMLFDRNAGVNNATEPAEWITFNPKYLYILADFLGSFSASYRESNP
jgi:hypothetical protein